MDEVGHEQHDADEEQEEEPVDDGADDAERDAGVDVDRFQALAACPSRALQSGEQRSTRASRERRGMPFQGAFPQVRPQMIETGVGDFQAYGAGSIPVIRSYEKAQVSDLGLLCCLHRAIQEQHSQPG
ncbi:hypothetical protein [Streptomyces sp. NPDC058664]|uniref:hypothetical protein n=1 Tax=unclassified Streptomyces TaxID=2593676 RepID=UPI00364C0A35